MQLLNYKNKDAIRMFLRKNPFATPNNKQCKNNTKIEG